VILNFTPVPRQGYRLGVPVAGHYKELLNSDSAFYGGSNLGNVYGMQSQDIPWMNHPHSIELTLPPLAGLVIAL
jgi:1,4-alpha-glucan branching enzyme